MASLLSFRVDDCQDTWKSIEYFEKGSNTIAYNHNVITKALNEGWELLQNDESFPN